MFSLKFKILYFRTSEFERRIAPNSALRYENLPELSPVTNIAIVDWKYSIPFFINQHQATLSAFGIASKFRFIIKRK